MDVSNSIVLQTEDIQRYQPLIDRLITRILALGPMYQQLLQARKDKMCKKIVSLFVELGESLLLLLLNGSPQSQNGMVSFAAV